MIRKNSSELSVRRQCELLRIHHSSVYATPPQPKEEKHLLREAMMARLDYWHTTLSAMGSRKLWSIDITYIKLYRSHLYLTAIIDWFSRKIIG